MTDAPPTPSSAEFPECNPAQLTRDRQRRTVQADVDRPVTDYEAFHRACFGNDDWEGT